jgi:hypothetical protein
MRHVHKLPKCGKKIPLWAVDPVWLAAHTDQKVFVEMPDVSGPAQPA